MASETQAGVSGVSRYDRDEAKCCSRHGGVLAGERWCEEFSSRRICQHYLAALAVFLYSAASYGGRSMDTSGEQARKLRNLAQASLRFGRECDKVRGRKHWALDAKLRAWKLEREAKAVEAPPRA